MGVDFLGNGLRVSDEVVFIKSEKRSFQSGIVAKITDKGSVIISVSTGRGYERVVRHCKRVVKVTQEFSR